MYPKELKAGIRISVPMPTAALFTKSKYTHTHKTSTQNKRWMDKQNVVLTSNGMLFSLKKEGDSDTRYKIDDL